MIKFLIIFNSIAPALGVAVGLVSAVTALGFYLYTKSSNKKRATLDMILGNLRDSDVRENYDSFRDLMLRHKCKGTHKEFDLTALADDAMIGDSNRRCITKQMNLYELTSIGIRTGLLDEGYYKRWYHKQFIKDYEDAKSFIDQMQKQSPTSYCECKYIYEKWKKSGHAEAKLPKFKILKLLVTGEIDLVINILQNHKNANKILEQREDDAS